MFEVRVTISAPELAQAINNLAAALVGVKPQQAAPAPQQAPAPVPQAAPMQAPAPMPQQTAPVQPQQTQGYAPANPTPAATSPDRCAGCTDGWPDLCIPF